MTASLCFNGFTFSPVTRDNQPWFKSSEIARALGYAREDTLSRLYDRNADEFTENMTQVVENLDTVNLTVRVRIFSLRGCHLLAMFARTPVAKAFRKWVLDVIEQYGDRVPVAHPVTLNDAPISPEQRAELKLIVDSKAGMVPKAVQRRAYKEIWTRFNRHFHIAEYKQLPCFRMDEARDFLLSMQVYAGKIETLPQATLPSPRKIHDEVPYLDFVDEMNRAHMQVQEIQQHLSLKAIKLTLSLCHDIEDRANMPSRVSGHSRCCILESVLLDQINHGISEALTYPSNNLPNSSNPGYSLLGIVRQLNGNGRA